MFLHFWQVFYSDLTAKTPEQVQNTTKTSFTIENLTPNRNYSIAIRTVNGIGPGPRTKAVIVLTGESGK